MTPADRDDGLECAGMLVATRDALAHDGIELGDHAFVIFAIRRARERALIASPTIENVASLISELRPPIVEVAAALHEDHDALLAQIRGRGREPCTLH
jgi:hypothetical protein